MLIRINAYKKEQPHEYGKYIGLDARQGTISAAVLDSAGKLVMDSIVETQAATILQFVDRQVG